VVKIVEGCFGFVVEGFGVGVLFAEAFDDAGGAANLAWRGL
jgi:hypothetical protein